MKRVGRWISVAIVGAGLYAIATSSIKFTELGFSELAKPVGEEVEMPEFSVSEDAYAEGYEIMEEALDSLSISENEASVSDNEIPAEDGQN